MMKLQRRSLLLTFLMFNIFFLVTLTDAQATKPPQPPMFVKKLEKHILLAYGPLNRFVLECSASGEPMPKYSWFKNGKPLAEDVAGIKLITAKEHSMLEFDHPAPEHEGYYHCFAENEHGRAKSTEVLVSPNPEEAPKGTRPPVFTQAPEIQVIRAGNTAKFRCEATGVPPPTNVWTKNGEVLAGETGTELVVHDVGPTDVANYACNSSNIAGYAYRDTYINFLTVPAIITEGPRDQIVSKGSNVTLKCETDGYPKPSVEWFVNGTSLTHLEEGKFNVDEATGSLLIRNADLADEGEYKCVASNHGTAEVTGSLVVKSKTEIINGPADQSVQVFATVVMNCSVVSDLSEKLTVIWKKDNVDLGQSVYTENARISQDENYNLIINNVSLDDEGTYTCVAYTESTVSDPATDSGLLTVSGIKPVLADIQPIDDQLEGADIDLHCQVLEGFERPEISWFKNGLPVETDAPRLTIDYDVLRLKSATTENSGEYTCQAVNSAGRASQGIQVWVRRKTKILTEPVYVAFSQGTGVRLHCSIDVDPSLTDSLQIDWYRGSELLAPTMYSNIPSEEEESLYDYEEDRNRYTVYPNHTLEIRDLHHDDVGLYKCVASTALEPLLHSAASEIYVRSEFPYWIFILIGMILVVLIILAYCVWRIRQRSKGKGYYGVKDIEQSGNKHNKSDIYYTTEDGDSIMLEQDNVPFSAVDPASAGSASALPRKPPIFTPKTIRQLAAMDKSTGSCGSLLDDEFLKRGMDEDGSFRERYAD